MNIEMCKFWEKPRWEREYEGARLKAQENLNRKEFTLAKPETGVQCGTMARPTNTESKHSTKDEVSWLISRVAEQARADLVRVTPSELEQLSFSEETASPAQVGAAADFDAENDVSAFEAKIAKLLGSAYKQDIEKGAQSVWHKHLTALRDKDVYILVMVDQAGIPRPKPKQLATLAPTTWRRILPMVRFAVSGFVSLAGLLYFLVFSMRWERRNPNSPYVFGALGRFRLSDNMAALFFVAWLVSLFLMWRDTTDEKKR